MYCWMTLLALWWVLRFSVRPIIITLTRKFTGQSNSTFLVRQTITRPHVSASHCSESVHICRYARRLIHLFQILVTHHVELVLPGTYYLVRMLDGRIDTQGTVKELRACGVLDNIAHDESLVAHNEEQAIGVTEGSTAKAVEVDALHNTESPKAKVPRKLVEEERRETEPVKWSIYKTYLKAS